MSNSVFLNDLKDTRHDPILERATDKPHKGNVGNSQGENQEATELSRSPLMTVYK